MHRSFGGMLFIPAIAWASLGNSGCKEESPVESNLATLPALADPIPFDRLGEGKLVFERVQSGEMNGTIYLIRKDRSGLTQVTFADGVADRSLSWSH